MTMIDISSLELAEELKETVAITRVNLDSDPTGGTTISIATAVELIILPATTQGDQTQGTGFVALQGYYQGYMLTPNTDIKAGDIITTEPSSQNPDKLYIDGEPFLVGGVQWFNLATTQRTG